MRCLLLAAGYATRLRPLTDNFPKPLLKVGDKAILDWLVDDIAASGLVKDFAVISNHRFAQFFDEWAASRPEDIKVVDDGTSTNETRLGAVKDILFAMESLATAEDLLVIAGDNLLDFSLSRFIQYSISKGTSCVMRYHEPSETRLRKCGVLEIDGNDRILSMEEKPAEPKSHWCCPPFYYYTREDASLLKRAVSEGCATDAPGSFVSWLAPRSAVHAMEMPGRRYDIGDVQSYSEVCRTYRGVIL